MRFQCPSRCTQVQIYLKYTSGWANIGHFRCIAKNRHTKIHRDSSIHSNPDVSKSSIHRNYSFIPDPDVFILISRECTCFPLQNTPAQAGINPAGYIGICYSKGIPMYYRLPYQPVIHQSQISNHVVRYVHYVHQSLCLQTFFFVTPAVMSVLSISMWSLMWSLLFLLIFFESSVVHSLEYVQLFR